MAGSTVWGQNVAYRTRLLFCGYSSDCDKPEEFKARLKLWEKGKFDELAARAYSSAMLASKKAVQSQQETDELERRDLARAKACHDALRKAIQGFVSGTVVPTQEQSTAWAELFLSQVIAWCARRTCSWHETA